MSNLLNYLVDSFKRWRHTNISIKVFFLDIISILLELPFLFPWIDAHTTEKPRGFSPLICKLQMYFNTVCVLEPISVHYTYMYIQEKLSTSKLNNYVYMLQNNVNMQLTCIYVNMQLIFVDMQHNDVNATNINCITRLMMHV